MRCNGSAATAKADRDYRSGRAGWQQDEPQLQSDITYGVGMSTFVNTPAGLRARRSADTLRDITRLAVDDHAIHVAMENCQRRRCHRLARHAMKRRGFSPVTFADGRPVSGRYEDREGGAAVQHRAEGMAPPSPGLSGSAGSQWRTARPAVDGDLHAFARSVTGDAVAGVNFTKCGCSMPCWRARSRMVGLL